LINPNIEKKEERVIIKEGITLKTTIKLFKIKTNKFDNEYL